ncbi:methyl-accepting chemotaxis protein [Paraburkholderia phosphatilytica]|uniref:methyl-accepting chemotaxis protein n=1 Tax=Paraburkholderia phosphatilytica TaxID=2282883 RepID=UPI000E4D173F|nr:methyl-accepting chemotaxis protein [Paraburkholderia phosphatilytica]
MKDLSIRARLALCMALLGALLVASVSLGLYGMKLIDESVSDLAENSLPGVDALANAEIFMARSRLVFDRIALQPQSPDVPNLEKRGVDLLDQSDQYFNRYDRIPRGADEDALASRLKQSRADLRKLIGDFSTAIAGYNQGEINRLSLDALPASYDRMVQASTALKQFQVSDAAAQQAANQARYRRQQILGFASVLVGIAAAFGGWFFLRAAIVGPLAEALAHLDGIARGDLTRSVRIHREDEMGQLLLGVDRMREKLALTVGSVRSGSETIATATRQIAAGNTDLSSRTEEQAASLQETAASMEELTATVRQNTENAQQGSALADNACQVAARGNEIVREVVETMMGIEESSSKIADIIGLIEGIAFQTNILALNAAVEAARAGEQGRGFAVVAGEVRSLAQRSSTAAGEIKELIVTSGERVRTGSGLVNRAGANMTEIGTAIQRVTDIMNEISAASTEQSRGIEQVNQAITQMDQVTQQNAALVEQAAAAAGAMSDQAEQLRGEVSVFQLP